MCQPYIPDEVESNCTIGEEGRGPPLATLFLSFFLSLSLSYVREANFSLRVGRKGFIYIGSASGRAGSLTVRSLLSRIHLASEMAAAVEFRND